MATDAPRLPQLVKGGKPQAGLEAFGQAVMEVLGEHPDIASEAAWQALAQLIAAHWTGLCREQPPLGTWGMLTKCSEAIVRLRKEQAAGRGDSASDALEEFRQFMGDVMGDETQE